MKTLCAVFITLVSALPALALAQDWRRQGEVDRRVRERVNTHQPLQAAGCNSPATVKLEDPRIEIVQQNSQPSARTVHVKGVIEGVCLSEAGLYENGQQRKRISVSTLPTFKRFSFDLTAAPGTQREIRAYNTQGGYSAFALPDTNLQDDPLGIGVDRPSDSDYGDDADDDTDNDGGSEKF
jgi:hypothetical protein